MPAASRPIRVLLVEDDELARRAVDSYLAPLEDIALIGAASDGREALTMAEVLSPDVVLVDVHLPGVDGLEVIRHVASRLGASVVCFTALADDRTLARAIEDGAAGFLLKTDSPGLIATAIRSAHSGDALVSPKLMGTLLRQLRARVEAPAALTPEDRNLLALVGRGHTNSEIGSALGLAVSSVRECVAALLSRFDLLNRAGLAMLAYRWGLLDD